MSYTNLSPEAFKAEIAATENAFILDVRTPAELAEGNIEGAVQINIMAPDFAEKIDQLDKDKTYFVFCRAGGRSANACNYMLSNGFQKCYNLDGGITAWNQMI